MGSVLCARGIQMEIEITRPKQIRDRIRDYHLVVDGKKLVKIKPNSTTSVQLPEGTEFIQAKIDWCSSPLFNVKDIKGNRVVIKNSMGGGIRGSILKTLFMPLYYVTFGKGKYLTIESGTYRERKKRGQTL